VDEELVFFSFFALRYNEPIMKPEHHQNQDTDDRFMANIQRNGTFSVVPRIAAGEITPEGLIAMGQVARKYNLYTKVRCVAIYGICVRVNLGLVDYGWSTDRYVWRDEGRFAGHMGGVEQRWVRERSGVWEESEDRQILRWHHLYVFVSLMVPIFF